MTTTTPPTEPTYWAPPWTPDARTWAPAVELIVFGRPAPQGSKVAKGRDKAGHTILGESSKHVKPWRADVARIAEDAWRDRTPLDGPLLCEIVFTRPRPTSAAKRRRYWASTTPDLDKLARSTFDALKGRLWVDDSRAVWLIATKLAVGDRAALDRPGCVIRVWEMTDDLDVALNAAIRGVLGTTAAP